MRANIEVVERRLRKKMDDGWERKRDEWHIESVTAYDYMKIMR